MNNYCTVQDEEEDKLSWKISDGDTIIFNGLIYSDDGFGHYIEADMRTCLYVLYNWVM